jgi:TfoX N-terminal domain
VLPAIITAGEWNHALRHSSGMVKLARDKGLEELLNDSLATVPGLTQKAMFGGCAWLVNGNLLCGARSDGMLLRLGKENEAWALEIPGVVPMVTRGRQMRGWVRAAPDVYGNDALRQRLVDAALEFNRSLRRSRRLLMT